VPLAALTATIVPNVSAAQAETSSIHHHSVLVIAELDTMQIYQVKHVNHATHHVKPV